MGCTSSKQQSPEERPSEKNRGRNRSRHYDSDSPPRGGFTPPKLLKREDAFNYGRSSDIVTQPTGWSRRTVNELTRSESARGTAVSLAPPTGFPGYVGDRLLPATRSRDERGYGF